MTTLAKLNLLLLTALAGHTLDHGLNQPARTLPASADAIGIAGFVIVTASAVLAIRRSPAAPLGALLAGSATVLGLLAVHLTPFWWEAVSDPLWDFGANAVTWVLTLVVLALAVCLAVRGARELPSRRAA